MTHKPQNFRSCTAGQTAGQTGVGLRRQRPQLVSPATAHSSHGILGGNAVTPTTDSTWVSTAVFYKVHRVGSGVIWKDSCMLRGT